VSCYTRHLEEFLPAEPGPLDKRALDRAVRDLLDLPAADCPVVWQEVKDRRQDPAFGPALRERIGEVA